MAVCWFIVLVLLLIIVYWCVRTKRPELEQSSSSEEEGGEDGDRERGGNKNSTASISDRVRKYLWDKYSGVKDHFSRVEAQPGDLAPPTSPPRPLESDVIQGNAAAEGGDPQEGVGQQHSRHRRHRPRATLPWSNLTSRPDESRSAGYIQTLFDLYGEMMG